MAIYCNRCGTQRGFPMSSLRAVRSPCNFCGSYDQVQTRNRRGEVKTTNLPNYSYPDNLLSGTASDVNTQAEKEYENTR